MTISLTPSLWRTCRVLANPLRLACLHAVCDDRDHTVSELAQRARLSPTVASLYLRQLQARGLIRSARVGRWVRYSAVADPAVAHAAEVLTAMKRALLRSPPPYRRLFRTLTGFTHPRRLVILRALPGKVAVPLDWLRDVTGIPIPALTRHLDKLRRHGLAQRSPSGWRLAPSLSRLAQALISTNASATGSRR
jgi:DNA-binding transcriptional ArsR family regulator